jgi:nucleoporin NDC1
VATLQLGRRSTTSPFDTCRRCIFSLDTIQILVWYLFSACWFSEIFIWSSPRSEKLGWIVKGDMSTPDRLNERPIYLRSVFVLLALCQTVMHIYNDDSSVHIPVSMPTKTPSPDNRTHKLAPITLQIQRIAWPRLAQRCIAIPLALAVTGPVIYVLFLRQTFWSWHLTFAKLIYSLPRSDARPTGYPPGNPAVMALSAGVGFLLMLTWEATSFFFSALLAQEPVKKDQPLSQGSKDPNGTLITGLRAKREVVRTFAFWELVIIAQKHPERRKLIFADIGREGGRAWDQMLGAALDVVQAINYRIEATTTQPNPVEQEQNPDAMEIDSLPRIAPPIKEKPIFAQSPPPQTRTEEIESYLDWGARRIGQSKDPFEPPFSKWRELLKYMTGGGHSQENSFISALSNFASNLLKASRLEWLLIPVKWFFRPTFSRKVNTTILGHPQANAAVITDAIESITRMLVASLSEDLYGTVISGVPVTVRALTNTINAIESYVQHHVKEEAGPEADIDEVEIVLARLKAGLAELLGAFQLFLVDQGVSAAEHRSAQNAARPGRLLPEREERRRVKEREKDMEREEAKRKELEVRRRQQQQQQQKDPKGKGAIGEKGPVEGKGAGKENAAAEKRPQKRLEPQDPARKKLFQDTVPKSMRRKEMEMVGR